MGQNKPEVKKDVLSETQNEMFEALIETLLPKIKPFIKPATEKLREWVNSGKTIVVKSIEGEPYAFIMNDSDIETLTLKEGASPESTHSLEDTVEKIISGSFGK